MSVRLFAGYFLALAACAIIAFGASEPEPAAVPFSAEAGMMPMGFPADSTAYPADSTAYPGASFSVHRRLLSPKRTRLADAQ